MTRILPLLLLLACGPVVEPVREVQHERVASSFAGLVRRHPERATRSSARPHVHPKPPQKGRCTSQGRASWYRHPRYPGQLITAHLTLPMGTRIKVWYGKKSVVVVVRDRGPKAWTGKCLDLSDAAFSRLAPLSKGVLTVRWEKL